MSENKERSEKIKSANFRLVIGTMAGSALLFSGVSLGLSIYNTYRSNGGTSFLYSLFDGNYTSFTDGTVAEVSNRVAPSVVSILTETRTTNWFGQDTTSSAAGTGVIVTSNGYVLTNKHVVEGAKKIEIVTSDGATYSDVTLVGTDPLNDIAFIKINSASNFTPATLGDSKTLQTGQQVIAIGNALGQYHNTVTQGIISGTGRDLIASDKSNASYYERLSDMIQTDAAINGGNSGGPLLNGAGQVIGINTAVYSDGNGIGFAIPISAVKGMLRTIINTGKAERAYIGVSYVNITPSVKEQYSLASSRGAYVSGSPAIIKDSPADRAGLADGDIITRVNGVEVGTSGSLATLIGEYGVGDTVELTYLRNGEERTTKLTLEAYKAPE
ncbi:trypsin-like peptidase domain-containing protein [Candidatus Saccharibacteria bacterium]|nr:trypsin-like peptidase domain-containing protein [Candidatus Saccharibacteria bacterium]